MLRSELIRPRLEVQGDRVWTRSVPIDYHYLRIAGELGALFRRHVGRRRGELDDALRDFEGDSLDYPVIRGLAAVLERNCTFDREPPVDPALLRAALFARGPVTRKRDLFHPASRAEVVAETAADFGLTPQEVEDAMFADLAEEQVLRDAGDPVAPGDLIARYNLELARGLLYWAREVRLQTHDHYKDLFKYLKLFKLMYTLRPMGPGGAGAPEGYHVTLHGPISPFVASTIRYGLQFAKFMPAILLGERWRMEADVQPPRISRRDPLRYTLTDATDLRTHFKPSTMFDSRLEADFAAEFEEKYSGPQRPWILSREDELIVTGDTVMIPDFALTHRKDGCRVLIEIVGFWHPHYLRRKLEKVRQAGRRDLILLVYKSVNVAQETFAEASAGEVLMFTRRPILKDVLAAAERYREERRL